MQAAARCVHAVVRRLEAAAAADEEPGGEPGGTARTLELTLEMEGLAVELSAAARANLQVQVSRVSQPVWGTVNIVGGSPVDTVG